MNEATCGGKVQEPFRIVVKALAPAIDYGSSPIMVTDDRVSAAQLNVRPVTDVQLHMFAKPSKPHLSELVSRVQSSFTHQYQVYDER